MAPNKGKRYGKDSTENPAVSKYASMGESDDAGAVEWADVSGPLIKQAISAVTEDGCSLILGKTRDGGALSLTLLHTGAPIKKYAKSAQIAESVLQELIARASD